MYVCNCQGVREAEISHTIRTGATTLRALRELLGVGTCCGKCVCDVREQLERELSPERGCTGCGQCQGACAHADDAHEPEVHMAMC